MKRKLLPALEARDYPPGAIKNIEEFKVLLAQAKTRKVKLYSVYDAHPQGLEAITLLPYASLSRPDSDGDVFLNVESDRLYSPRAICLNWRNVVQPRTSTGGNGFLFQNYWFAYAYMLRGQKSAA